VTGRDCSWLTEEQLNRERLAMGDRWYNQEFMCSFQDVVGAIFPEELIERAFSDEARYFDIAAAFRGGL
jgi:hypothetical protein